MEPPYHLDQLRNHLGHLDDALLVALERVGQMLAGHAVPGKTQTLFCRCSNSA